MAKGKTEEHNFYCCRCGQKGLPIMRSQGAKREKLHRKKLYCIWCQETVNHVECCNQFEVEEFYEKFENGDYKEEGIIENDLFNVWDTRLR